MQQTHTNYIKRSDQQLNHGCKSHGNTQCTPRSSPFSYSSKKKKKKAFFAEGGFVHSVFTSTQAEVLEVPAEQELRKIRIRIKRIFHRNDDGLFHCDIGTVYLGNVKALQHEIQNVIYNI